MRTTLVAATWVGGAFIIGVAETVYDPTKGLVWALIPLQMSVSFIIGKTNWYLHPKEHQSGLSGANFSKINYSFFSSSFMVEMIPDNRKIITFSTFFQHSVVHWAILKVKGSNCYFKQPGSSVSREQRPRSRITVGLKFWELIRARRHFSPFGLKQWWSRVSTKVGIFRWSLPCLLKVVFSLRSRCETKSTSPWWIRFRGSMGKHWPGSLPSLRSSAKFCGSPSHWFLWVTQHASPLLTRTWMLMKANYL